MLYWCLRLTHCLLRLLKQFSYGQLISCQNSVMIGCCLPRLLLFRGLASIMFMRCCLMEIACHGMEWSFEEQLRQLTTDHWTIISFMLTNFNNWPFSIGRGQLYMEWCCLSSRVRITWKLGVLAPPTPGADHHPLLIIPIAHWGVWVEKLLDFKHLWYFHNNIGERMDCGGWPCGQLTHYSVATSSVY